MTTEPVNAICLGGPCHGTLLQVDHDSGVVLVPLPSPGSGTADYHVTAERIHHSSYSSPVTVLHWNHTITPYHCRADSRGTMRPHI